ncbi:MAG: RlmE family RNA methyltransferase [Patescibacteria group bacterium]
MYRQDLKEEYYTLKAKQDKYPARSVYKLQQIDEKFNLFKKNDKVLDLGCAPGSWLLYASRKIGEKGAVTGVDLEDLKTEIPSNATFLKLDVSNFGNSITKKFNVIMSDMAPNTSGDHSVDVQRSIELCEMALEIAKVSLNKGGNFLCKIFEGEGIQEFFKKMEQSFSFVKRYKPLASRSESREIFIIGKNFNG